MCYALCTDVLFSMLMDIIWTATPKALVSSDMGGNFPNKTFAPTNTSVKLPPTMDLSITIRHPATQQDKELPEIFTFVKNLLLCKSN